MAIDLPRPLDEPVIRQTMLYSLAQTVQDMNTFRREFFGRFFAAQAGIDEAAVYFEAEEGAKAVPKVAF